MMSQGVVPTPALTPEYSGSGQRPTNFRWLICGLLFYATTVNYIDRSTVNTLEPTLRNIIHWRPYQYGLINAVFSLAYGIGFIIMGGLVDKIGTRVGYAVAMIGWSLAGIATAFSFDPMSFGLCRFFLGLFEAGNFPAAIKTTAEWFPQKQRATATGLFNAGSNVGAIAAPLIVIFLVPFFGWRAAFFVTPGLVLIWLILWLTFYRPPALQSRANDAERALIEADPIVVAAPVKWRNILPHGQAWGFMVGKFLTDPIWWFYLFWSGAFLYDKFGVKLTSVALPLIYIYVLADVGSILGGWLSSALIRRGWTPNAARKTAMLVCAAFVVPVIFAPLVPSSMAGGLWVAATLLGSAAAAHQGFSANIFTTTSDMFPKRAVSSVTGLGGLAGALGSVILQSVAGVTIELTHGNYLPLFIVAACAYPIAILFIHLFAPRLQKVSDTALETTPMPRAVTAFVCAVVGFVIAVPVSYYFQGGNAQKDRLYSQSTLITMAVTEEADALPHDLVDKVDIKDADKATTKVTLTTKREPTAEELPKVEHIREYQGPAAYEMAKEHFPPGFKMSEYLAAVLPPGNIYKSPDRDELLKPLVYTPLAGIAIGAILGALLHGLFFKRRSSASPAA
ncbi:MAG TPA: MFS transporter [Phycisphaerae bacterium]|nr:MFS transporter [Phycisphaerae bacterium]